VLGRTARLLKTRHCFAYQVGIAYKKGRGVITNDVEALKWFLRTAEKNFPMAQGAVAAYYLDHGQDQDARPYAESGASQGDALSETIWACF
jgi:TPR repeat protein